MIKWVYVILRVWVFEHKELSLIIEVGIMTSIQTLQMELKCFSLILVKFITL